MTRTFLDAGDEVWDRVFWTEEQLDAHLRHVSDELKVINHHTFLPFPPQLPPRESWTRPSLFATD